jgi:hypothetical protein
MNKTQCYFYIQYWLDVDVVNPILAIFDFVSNRLQCLKRITGAANDLKIKGEIDFHLCPR